MYAHNIRYVIFLDTKQDRALRCSHPYCSDHDDRIY